MYRRNKLFLSVRDASDAGSHSSPSSPQHAIFPPLQETHLLLEMYLLMAIYFSWFAFVPQFSPPSRSSISLTRALQSVCLPNSNVLVQKHHGVPAACLGTWKPV